MANTKKDEEKKTTAKSSGAKKTTSTKKTAASKTTAAKKTSAAKKATATKASAAKKSSTAKKTTASKATAAKNTAAKKTTAKVEKEAPKKEVIKEEKVESVKVESSKSNLIKGIVIIVLLVVFFAVIFVISNNSGKGEYSKVNTNNANTYTDGASSESSSISEDEMGDLTAINIDEYLELKKGSEYSVIYIGRPTCSHCQVQQPIMRNIVYKYGIVINYLNTDELDDDGIQKLQKSDDYFSEGWGTPLTLVVKDDKIVDKIEGEASSETVVEMFKKYDIISE